MMEKFIELKPYQVCMYARVCVCVCVCVVYVCEEGWVCVGVWVYIHTYNACMSYVLLWAIPYTVTSENGYNVCLIFSVCVENQSLSRDG